MTELTIKKTDGQATVDIGYGKGVPRMHWLSLAGQLVMLGVLYYFIDRAQPDCEDSCPMNDYAPWLWVLLGLLVLSMAGDVLKIILLAKGKEHIVLNKDRISHELKWGLISRKAEVAASDIRSIRIAEIMEAPVRKAFGGYLKHYGDSPEKVLVEHGRKKKLIAGILLQEADTKKLFELFAGFYPEATQKA